MRDGSDLQIRGSTRTYGLGFNELRRWLMRLTHDVSAKRLTEMLHKQLGLEP